MDGEHAVRFANLDKVFYPAAGTTKGVPSSTITGGSPGTA